jgi:hypothetical protein
MGGTAGFAAEDDRAMIVPLMKPERTLMRAMTVWAARCHTPGEMNDAQS